MIKAQFSGIKLVPKDLAFPEAGALTGDFGKEALDEYQALIAKDYEGVGALDVLKYSNGVVRGSNPFAVVLMNQVVRPLGLRTASPADLERALESGLDLRGTYEDSALALRTTSGANAYLAKNLMEQVKARQKVKGTVIIPLYGLDLVKDSSSDYGLAFKLRDDAQVIEAAILNQDGNFDSKDIDFKTGLPRKLGQGSRILYTRSDGLSRLFLNRNSYLVSYDNSLVGSGEVGRVILASTEGAKPAQKVLVPTLQQVLKYSNQFVPAVVREQFEKGLEALFKKQ